MEFQKVRIQDIPGNTMIAFRRAAALRDASVTDVINWCIQIAAAPGPQSALYWVVPKGGGNQDITRINLAPTPPGDPTLLTINLLDEAVRALERAKQRYRCDEAGVIARAAWLAVYFGRTDGRLASGRAYKGHNVSVSALRYLT